MDGNMVRRGIAGKEDRFRNTINDIPKYRLCPALTQQIKTV